LTDHTTDRNDCSNAEVGLGLLIQPLPYEIGQWLDYLFAVIYCKIFAIAVSSCSWSRVVRINTS
jgi:hypothetical protein